MFGCPRWSAAHTVIPLPAELSSTSGAFTLREDSLVLAPRAARSAAILLADQLRPATGFALRVRAHGGGRRCRTRQGIGCRTWIRFARSKDRTLGDEGYRLEVHPGGVVIRARAAPGWFYGAQTLRQLLPSAILGDVVVDAVWTAQALTIRDVPRFAWRGVLLDSARHFFPPEVVERLIDQMAFHKLNRLHWHLTDDQGWRLEIRAFPELITVGATRAESPNRPLAEGAFLNFFVAGGTGPWTAGFDGTPYGGHYSQDEVRAIVAYAAARHVTIVPEVDMPGHVQSAIAAYPALGSGATAVPVKTSWGLPTAVLNPRDETFTFIATILDEVTDLFPGEFIHIGGDEVGLADWKTNPDAQARMTELGLPDIDALKEWFVDRIAQMVLDRGRRPIGWNESLHASLPVGAAITSWIGMQPGLQAARSGHDVVMAPIFTTYLDHANGLPLPPADQSVLEADPQAVSLAPAFVTDVPELYAFDPLLPEMTAAEAAHVLGGQGQLWSEFIHDQADLDRQAFPRLCALAETLWTPRARQELTDFSARLAAHQARLEALGIRFYRPQP